MTFMFVFCIHLRKVSSLSSTQIYSNIFLSGVLTFAFMSHYVIT